MAALDAEGVFDVIGDDDDRAASRAATQAGLERHFSAFLAYFIASVELTLPAGRVIDDGLGNTVGQTRNDETVTIS